MHKRTPGSFRVPPPPAELSYREALRDPMLLPLETRAAAAHALLDAGEIDGWDALALTIFGCACYDDELPPEELDEHGDWIIADHRGRNPI